MMKQRKTLPFMLFAFLFCAFLQAQNEPVIVEAESGTLGSDFNTLTDGSITYITAKTDLYNNIGTYPSLSMKVATYSVTFADSGTYKLFIKARVSSTPAGANNDSYHYGNGFGTKDTIAEADWITCNNLHTAGYSVLSDVVQNQGDVGTNAWKWISMSDYTGLDAPITFRVELGDLTKTFQVASREDGFDIDKIAFGRQGIYYTVKNLDNGEAGSIYLPGEEPVGPPLAEGLDKFLGCAFGPDSRKNFAGYWNQVTPGNGGKWGWVEGKRDTMSWGDLDEAYKLAQDSGMPFKMHVMVWGSQQPTWIETLDSAEQRAEIEEWFDTVANRYDTITMVEVVNEPLHAPPNVIGKGNYAKALGGDGVTGWDWVIESFRLARKNFPNSILMINDYNIINSETNTDNYLKIIKLLQAEDTLIDAIGFQSHGFSLGSVTSATVKRNLDSMAATGLDIYVTELDVDGYTDLAQLQKYQQVFPLYWEHPSVKGVTLWGFRPAMWRGADDEGRAFLITNEGVERPAMTWLRAYLKGTYVAQDSVDISIVGGAAPEINTLNGTLQFKADVFPDTATFKNVIWSVSPSNTASIDTTGKLTALKNGTVKVKATAIDYGTAVFDTISVVITNQASGIEHTLASDDVVVYPNPAKDGMFTIKGTGNIARIDVADLSGRNIKVIDCMGQLSVQVQLNVTKGIYILRLYDGQQYTFKKLLIE